MAIGDVMQDDMNKDKHDQALDALIKQSMQDNPVPEADDNARKIALNLALAAFDAEAAKKSEKTFQGFITRLRLNRKATFLDRRHEMKANKKWVYGGLATAAVLVMALSSTFLNTEDYKHVPFAPQGNKFNNIARNVNSDVPTLSGLTEEISRAVEKKTEGLFNNSDSNQIAAAPAPASAPAARMAAESMASADMAYGGASVPQFMPVPVPEPMPEPVPVQQVQGNDKFKDVEQNPVKQVKAEPVSTFSIDVDTASYSFVRRQINAGILPPADAVRIEELVNYFDYAYPKPESKDEPFKATVSVTPSPWHSDRQLMHVAIQGYEMEQAVRPHSNLVFLLDTSGSMAAPDKLPLVQRSMKMLLTTLQPEDTISIVTYAGSSGVLLEPTKVSEAGKITAAIDGLLSGGGTNGAAGLEQAYDLAQQNFDSEGINRVILATDGDFNIGMSSADEMKTYIEKKRESGIFLSVLGFGQGNLNDQLMQELAQNGNGVAAYIDSANEAQKVLVQEAAANLFPIAKDVKIQVDFNPNRVSEYRLIGYETRALNREDFNNDKVDAGDIGAGHRVTAIYEITPVGATPSVEPSRYETADTTTVAPVADKDSEYAFVKIRYKLPNEITSKLITQPVTDANALTNADAQLQQEVKWSIAVATFGELLKGGKYAGTLSYDDVVTMAQSNKGADTFNYRGEFIQLVRQAATANKM